MTIDVWESLSETTRGNGKDKNGKPCKGCQGTGLKKTDDGWCGCYECENNVEKFKVEF